AVLRGSAGPANFAAESGLRAPAKHASGELSSESREDPHPRACLTPAACFATVAGRRASTDSYAKLAGPAQRPPRRRAAIGEALYISRIPTNRPRFVFCFL